MKRFNLKTLAVLALAVALFTSCNDKWAIDRDNSIFVDPDESQYSEFDKWLQLNYNDNYNIEFKYKMEHMESDLDYQLVPASIGKSAVFAQILKYLWMEVYDEVVGMEFTRTYIPRIVHLIGSGAYNTNNTVLLGTAEGGLKVTLYRINNLPANVTGAYLNDNYMKTVHHEFMHILHQTKAYSADFQHISGPDYIGNEWSSNSNTLAIAQQKGFISRYARNNHFEDFVETIAYFITRNEAWWQSQLEAMGETGAEIMERKFAIVEAYLKDSWGIDIYDLRDVVQFRSDKVASMTWETFN